MGDNEDKVAMKVLPAPPPVSQQPIPIQHPHMQPSREYPPSGQQHPLGHYSPPGQYHPPGQYFPPGQHLPPGQHSPGVQYGVNGPCVTYQQPGVVYTQPGIVPPGATPPDVFWMMPPPQIPSGCPSGLEYLTYIDKLICEQLAEVLEVVTGFETNNKYKIKNSLGQNIYFAEEDIDTFNAFCGPGREFNMKILDRANNEVIHLYRPLRCPSVPCCRCFASCLHEIEVQAPPGTTIGYVIQTYSLCAAKFDICDERKNPRFKIENKFEDARNSYILALDDAEVGKITKQWRRFSKEDADTFSIAFSIDLDVKDKATIIGAAMLIDFMFYEGNHRDHYDSDSDWE